MDGGGPRGGIRRERSRALRWTAAALVVVGLAPVTASAATNNIFTVAGTGASGTGGNGGPALQAQFFGPDDVAVLPGGGYLVVDQLGHRVRRVRPDGIIEAAAGTGGNSLSGDGGPATTATLSSPTGVAVTPDGGFLIADSGNHRIRRVSAAGTISTVAGTTQGLSGDGGPATSAQLSFPSDVVVTADGGYLIAAAGNHRVRRVAPNGVITTVAGTTSGFSGDGGPATSAQLNSPRDVASTSDGGFLVADGANFRVRRVAPDGTITTVAGGGPGMVREGVAATVPIPSPADVEVTPDGGFLIAFADADSVSRVTPGGVITTVAGSTGGFSGDGGPATAAQLDGPSGLAVTSDGGFLVSEFFNRRVRFVDADLRFPQGPPGPTGPTGPQGPPGPAGPAGPDGPAASAPRVAVVRLGRGFYSARAGRPFAVRFRAAARSRAQLVALRGDRVVARSARAAARAGTNRIVLRAPRRAGTYRLLLTLRSSYGQVATDRARLVTGRAGR